VAPELMRFLFDKGFVALDGASLTVSSLDRARSTIEVNLIPETLARTTFGFKQVGESVNVEVDATTHAIVETVERLLADQAWRKSVGLGR
ncbi:MAG: riboflavin synthase, partial [Gammaproteobacteria bacterium]